HHAGRKLESWLVEGRVYTALIAVARIGDDAELAARSRHADRLPDGRLDQHVRSVLVAAGVFTAHDASDGFHTVVVSDHAHIGAEPVFPAVECQKRLAGNGPAHHEVALDLRRVEDMERASAVEGEIVRSEER